MARKPQDGGASARVKAMAARQDVAAPDFLGDEDGAPRRDPGTVRLPPNCPVTPLGHAQNKLYFLDRSNQVIAASTRCEKGDMMLWFGDDWLCDVFPAWKPGKADEEPKKDGWNQKAAQVALVEDCQAKGIFNPQGRVLGRGAHRMPGDREALALHMGNRVVLANLPGKREGERQRTPVTRSAGRIVGRDGRDVYFPALETLPSPAEDAATAEECAELLQFLTTRWYWVEPKASPLLLFGMIAQMFVCGALDWRSHVWLAAPTASGKSSLQRIIRAIHDEWCLATEDSSEAAIRQMLGNDTLPVMIDEAEAHDRPERLAAIMNLMKKSSSGAKMYRGSTDHKAQEFTAQSCFLLSSVLHASMRGEDRNRIAVLQMRAIPGDAKPLPLELATWERLGRKMRRRMLENWGRFDDTLEDYMAAIARAGFEGRWRDTYGTLLACADLLLFDHSTRGMIPNPDEEPGPERVRRLVAEVVTTIQRGRVESRSDVDRVLVYLSTALLPGAHGKPPEPVAVWLERAMQLRVQPGQFPTDPDEMVIDEDARAKLRSHGLRVVAVEEGPGGKVSISDARPGRWDEAWLAVAYGTNRSICELFRNSEWADGNWLQSLGKLPGARKGPAPKVRFAGRNPDYALLVPLSAFEGEEG